MADLSFKCHSCKMELVVDSSGAGRRVPCPACGVPLVIPTARSQSIPDGLDEDPAKAFGMEDGGDFGIADSVNEAINDVKTVDYRPLFPFRSLRSGAILRKKAVRWVLLFGLLPLVIFQGSASWGLEVHEIIWSIQLYYCMFWALYYHEIVKPERRMWRQGVGYALFTSAIGIPLLLYGYELPFISSLRDSALDPNAGGRLVGLVLGVGILEELCKALPLLMLGMGSRRIASVRQGAFLGLMSGIGFAAAEGVGYTLQATVLASQFGTFREQFLQFLFRVMTGPVLHASWAGIVGWFIGVAATRGERRWPVVTLGILFAGTLHGLYNVCSGNIVGIMLAGLTFLIFLSYLADGEQALAESAANATAGRSGVPGG